MSQHPRPQGVPPNFIRSGIVTNVRNPPPQVIYNQLPYNIAAVPASSHFMPSTAYPSPYPDTSNRMNIRPRMQQVFVPVQHQPAQFFSGIPRQRAPADPTTLIEEQRKFERERNFQIQQQRLKQFTIAGKKGSMNADNLLDSMFGKSETKKHSSKPLHIDQTYEVKDFSLPESNLTKHLSSPTLRSSVIVVNQDDFPKVLRRDTKGKMERNPKDLENMMMKCSDFTGPQKAKAFHKPTVKDVTKSSHHAKTFAASEKAVDWRNVQGLDNVFILPKPSFPSWCRRESVPPLFLQICDLVSQSGQQSSDTNLLYSILISSGLQQGTLSEIWDMVNLTSPGCLTEEETFAALALVALAQAGHTVKNISVLHQLPVCPVPQLQYFNSPTSQDLPAVISPNADIPLENAANVSARPSSIPDFEENVAKDISSWKPFSNTEKAVKEEADDDFDDFKSATPMAVNAPPLKEILSLSADDDFGDFKQATEAKLESSTPSCQPLVNELDLMLPEDRYSVFRSLQTDSSDLEICVEASKKLDLVEKPATSAVLPEDLERMLSEDQSDIMIAIETDAKISNIEDDEFGDFLDANIASAPTPNHTSTHTNIQLTITTDFADFSQLNEQKSEEPEDFGDFAAFQHHEQKLNVGQDYFFTPNKDSVSLAESQSISSLELGTFDGVGHSGDSKSSLSRQGSIPSLDLKVVCLGSTENGDEFGDSNSIDFSTTVTPPSVETNKVSDERTSCNGNSYIQPTPIIPLVDKYSVIRSEQVIIEDPHINDWMRCIKSCLGILQSATKIFNQMSCSTICNEVLSTEEGKNYIKNVIEVYKVVCRVSLSSKSYEKQNSELLKLIDDADQSFNTLVVFLSGSPLLASDLSLDFSSCILKLDTDNNEKACGICLLNVDGRNKSAEEVSKLTYGRRQYHCACANLWVNCVDPLLPVLTLPHLI